MPLTGDFAALAQMIADLEETGARALPVATDAAKEEAQDQYEGNFKGQRDPWGNAWAPTATGKTPVLFQTGALSNALVSASTGTVRIKPPKYWAYHQIGANGMAQRGLLPFSASNWDPPLVAAIEAAIEELLPES